jgi:hypothetical protein
MPPIQMECSGEMEVFLPVVRREPLCCHTRARPHTIGGQSANRPPRSLARRLVAGPYDAHALTEEGASCQRAAERALHELEDAEQAVASGQARGLIRVNASCPSEGMSLRLAYHAFFSSTRDLTADHVSRTTSLSEKAEPSIRMGALPGSALKARKVAHSRRLICGPPLISNATVSRKGQAI